jgi:hypothetical protein
MNATNTGTSVVGRIVGGIFAGAVFGLLAQVIFLIFSDSPREDRRILFVGPGIGAVLVVFVAAFFGGCELPRAIKILSVVTLSGIVIGFVVGWAGFPLIMMIFHPDEGGKSLAGIQILGSVFGTSIGAIVGLLVGLSVWLRKRGAASVPLTDCDPSGARDIH